MCESHEERGISHLIEHMLFKGTQKLSVGEFAKEIESYGGETNAYTTFDATVYYLNLASEHAKRGLEMLGDVVLNSVFDAAELEKEKEVVVEEIRRSLDSPGQVFGQALFSLAYKGSVIARPIIGDEQAVKGFNRQTLQGFHQKWYQPSNLQFVVVSPLDPEFVRDKIEEMVSSKKSNDKSWFINQAASFDLRKIKSLEEPTVELIKSDFEQPRLELAFAGPSLEDQDTPALDLAAYILGAGEASRLYREIRDKKALATALSASLYTPSFAGLWTMSAYPVLEKFSDCLQGMLEELFKLKNQIKKIEESEFKRAIANFRAEKLYQEETSSGRASSYIQGLSTSYKQHFDTVYLEQIAGLSLNDVHSAIDRWINIDRLLVLAMVPKSSELSKDELKQALEEFKKTLTKSSQKTSAPSLEAGIENLRSKQKALKAVYHRMEKTPFFNLVAVCQGGLRYEDKKRAGLFHALSSLGLRASKKLSYEDVLNATEGRAASLEGFSGKDSVGFKLQCLPEHRDELLSLTKELLAEPEVPDFLWQSHLRETKQAIKREADSSSRLCVRQFLNLFYQNDHPYSFPVYGFEESLDELSPEILKEETQKHFKKSKWVLSAVGSDDASKCSDDLGDLLSLAKSPSQGLAAQSQIAPQSSKFAHHLVEREQVHILLAYPGFSWTDPRRIILDLLSSVLGGQGGRLFLRLRDEQSLAYTVAPYASLGIDQGYFGAYIASAGDKYDQALSGLRKELFELAETKIPEEELERAKNYVIGGHEQDMQRGESRAMHIALMGLYGLGFDEFETYSKKIRELKSEDLRSLAADLFSQKAEFISSVGPGQKESPF